MSATNRKRKTGPKHEREALDYYRTPDFATDAILPHLHLSGRILDVGCGDGAIAARLIHAGVHPTNIVGVEKHGPRARLARKLGIAVICGDYRRVPITGRYDLAMGNPPYGLALDFVNRSRSVVGATGTIALLLRVNWSAGQVRADWHRANPSDLGVLPRRPAFLASGSDATEYAWFLWGPGRGGRWFPLECEESSR